MPTTPLDADAIFKVHYTAKARPHVLNLRVNLTEPYVIGSDPLISSFTGGAYDKLSTVFMAIVVLAMKPMFAATDHFDGWEVWDMQTDPPTWIFAGTDATVGTGSNTAKASEEKELTLTFQDGVGKRFKHCLFGTVYGDLARGSVYAGNPWETWVTDMLSSAAQKVGDYICGRSAHRCRRFMSFSSQANNALEKSYLSE